MQLSLFHTTDFHARCTTENLLTGQKYDSSLANVASFFQAHRPCPSTSLTIDTGDFLQGSAITSYFQYAQPQMTHPVISFLNHYAYDAIIPGNHEFDYEPETLTQLLTPLEMPILAANFQSTLNNFTSHCFIEKQGVRFLIIGLTIPVNTQKYHFTDAATALRELLANISSETYDCLICAYHGGFTADPCSHTPLLPRDELNIGNQLLESFPEIDILLTGHQHQQLFGYAKGTYYSQAGSYAQIVNELSLDFIFDDVKERWLLQAVQCHTHKCSDYLPTPDFEAQIQTIIRQTQEWLQYPLARIATPLNEFNSDTCFYHSHSLIDLLHDFQQNWGQTPISAVSIPKTFALTDTHLRRHHLFQAFAYDDLLMTITVTGAELLTALQRLGDFFEYNSKTQQINRTNEPDYFYDLWSGITYTIHLQPNGKNWVSIEQVGNTSFSPTAYYQVTLNAFRANGGGGYPQFIKHTHKHSSAPVQKLFADFLQTIPENYEVRSTTNLSFIIEG